MYWFDIEISNEFVKEHSDIFVIVAEFHQWFSSIKHMEVEEMFPLYLSL